MLGFTKINNENNAYSHENMWRIYMLEHVSQIWKIFKAQYSKNLHLLNPKIFSLDMSQILVF